jgi:hypothetical protein
MNDFVNPQHRGVNLPPGFKDLMDVLEAKKANDIKHSVDSESPIDRIATGLADVEKYLRRFLDSQAKSALLLLLNDQIEFNFFRTMGKEYVLMFFRFTEEHTVRVATVRELFVERGIARVADSVVAGTKQRMIIYLLPAVLPDLSSISTEVLRRVYGISETDRLRFLFHE